MVLGLVLAGAIAGCKYFDRELTGWEAPGDDDETTKQLYMTGSVRVVIETEGAFPDQNGYNIWCDSMEPMRVESNDEFVAGPISWKSLTPNWYLGDVDPHCTIEDAVWMRRPKDRWSLGRWSIYEGKTIKRTIRVFCDH